MADTGRYSQPPRPGGHGDSDDDAPASPVRAVTFSSGETYDRNGGDEQRLSLARTIEGEVIPRLMLAHGVAPAKRPTRRPHGDGDVPPTWDDAAELARLVVAEEVPMALSFVDSLHDRGVTADAVLLDVCAPAARLLGQFWEQDLCSFAQVTIGLSRLQQLMRELSPALDQAFDRVRDDQKMLLLPAPGEQHTFGLSVLGLMLRQAGFQVYGGDLIRPEEATSLVRFERFVAIGFSASCDDRIEPLTELIRTIRRNTDDPDIYIMVGGNAFADQPERVIRVGADAMAVDGRQAVLHMQARLSRESLPEHGHFSRRGTGRGNVHPAPRAGEPLQNSRNIAPGN